MGGFIATYGGILIIIGFAWFLLAYWVSDDAEKRGEDPWIWFFVVLILGVIGLIIYWIAITPRPNQPSSSDSHSHGDNNRGRGTNKCNPGSHQSNPKESKSHDINKDVLVKSGLEVNYNEEDTFPKRLTISEDDQEGTFLLLESGDITPDSVETVSQNDEKWVQKVIYLVEHARETTETVDRLEEAESAESSSPKTEESQNAELSKDDASDETTDFNVRDEYDLDYSHSVVEERDEGVVIDVEDDENQIGKFILHPNMKVELLDDDFQGDVSEEWVEGAKEYLHNL